VGVFGLFDMEKKLSRLLGGRKVEVSTPESLSEYFWDSVQAEAETLHVQA
jgi:predicted nucleotidyltransferase